MSAATIDAPNKLSYDSIEKSAMALSSEEKLQLANLLNLSVDRSVLEERDEKWIAEAVSRSEAYDRGEIESEDGEIVMERLREEMQQYRASRKK